MMMVVSGLSLRAVHGVFNGRVAPATIASKRVRVGIAVVESWSRASRCR